MKNQQLTKNKKKIKQTQIKNQGWPWEGSQI